MFIRVMLKRTTSWCKLLLSSRPLRLVRPLLVLCLALLAFALVPAPKAHAASWTVCTSGCDFTSLSTAIAAGTTVNGDIITVMDAVRTEFNINVTKDLTIRGQGMNNTIVQANASPNIVTASVFIIGAGRTVVIENMTIQNGGRLGSTNGGGIYVNGANLTLNNLTLRDNNANVGGGLYSCCNAAYTVTLNNSFVLTNSAQNPGGGLYNGQSALLINNSTIAGNSSNYEGGGIWNDVGRLTINDSTVRGNSALYVGGGIRSLNSDVNRPLTINRSTISGNSSSQNSGGGLFHYYYGAISNSTISGNTAYGDAGGLFHSGGNQLDITHSTITRNHASLGNGGGVYNASGTVRVTSSLIVGNTRGTPATSNDIVGGWSNLGYNFVNNAAVAAALGPLADNGGPTFTHALLAGNAAINAGNCTSLTGPVITVDQRGAARPATVTQCDSGAFERTGLGDYVWLDADQDGIQDGGEPGLNGVVVNLYQDDGDNVPEPGGDDGGPVTTTTTGGNGSYIFFTINSGSYFLEFGAPPGRSFSPQDQGSDTLDSDADPATGLTVVFAYTAGQYDDSRDAGLRPGTFVWDGGGVDNNWSTGANWTGDTVPTAFDSVLFNATSTKNAIVDFAFAGTVNNLTVATGYTGSITQDDNLAVTGDYTQEDGTFGVTSIRSVMVTTMSENFANFSNISKFKLNGTTSQSGTVLRLTSAVGGQAGSAFYTTPVPVGADTSFSTHFQYKIHSGNGADGLVFMLQNSGAGINALGAAGGSLGYNGIAPSLAVAVRTYGGNRVEICLNGCGTVAAYPPPYSLRGSSQHIWIDYNGATNMMSVFVAQTNTKPASAVMTFNYNLTSLGAQAYMGFSAGTGAVVDIHDIEAWEFAIQNPQTIYPLTVGGNLNHNGGTLQQTQAVGSNSTVKFLEINNGAATIKYRGAELDTTGSGANLGNVTVAVTAVDQVTTFCTQNGASSPPYAGRCYEITPATNGAARVMLWALNSEIPGTITNPSVYHYDAVAGIWNELTNISTGNDGSNYTFAAGDTTGFSPFLIAQANASGPTAITLNGFAFADTTGMLPYGLLAAAAMFTLFLLLIRRRSF